MSKHPPIQDEITIQLQNQKTIVHETVRISVTVQAQVDPEQSEPDFRKEVQKTLRDFVPGDWRIQDMARSKGNQFETVSVTATVRVPDKENYQLEARASKVSRIGFELYYPRAEYQLTFDEIQAVNAELRSDLLRKALGECIDINKDFKTSGYSTQRFRIASSRFDHGNQIATSNNARPVAMQMMTASASPMSPLGGSVNNVSGYQTEQDTSGEDGSEDMGVSTRFSMVGTFVLRSVYNG